MRRALVVLLLLAACSSKEPAKAEFVTDGMTKIDGHPTLWRAPDGTIYGPCSDVRPYIATLDPQPGFACN